MMCCVPLVPGIPEWFAVTVGVIGLVSACVVIYRRMVRAGHETIALLRDWRQYQDERSWTRSWERQQFSTTTSGALDARDLRSEPSAPTEPDRLAAPAHPGP
jgi:hypothetical protein